MRTRSWGRWGLRRSLVVAALTLAMPVVGWGQIVPVRYFTGAGDGYELQHQWLSPKTTSYSASLPSTSYWSLDEASGTRIDATSAHDLAPTSTPPGVASVVSNGASFTTDQLLSVAHHADLQGGDVDLSVAFWTTPTLDTPTIDQYVLMGIYEEWKVYISGFGSLTNYFRFGWWNSDGTFISTPASPLVVYGIPHYVIAWRDSTAQTINIQVDFGPVYSRSSTGGGQITAEPFGIGGTPGGTHPGQFFEGVMDEVYLYRGLWTAEQKLASMVVELTYRRSLAALP